MGLQQELMTIYCPGCLAEYELAPSMCPACGCGEFTRSKREAIISIIKHGRLAPLTPERKADIQSKQSITGYHGRII